MEAPLIHERSDQLTGDMVEPTTNQRKTGRCEILNWRREIQLAEEPGLHRVLIGRSYVEQVSVFECPGVIVDDLVGNGGGGFTKLFCPCQSRDPNRADRHRER